MRVSDLMSRSVVTIGPGQSCHEAAARMHGARLRHLPVVDEAGGVVGVVTDRDLRHALFAPVVLREVGTVPVGTLLGRVPVKEVMSAPAVTVAPGEHLEVALARMMRERVGSLPVTEGDRVVGILTETDVLRQVVRADAGCTEVAAIVVSYP